MTRSWWGWGNVEDAADAPETATLCDRIRTLLPDHDLTDHPPPDPTQFPVRPPRIRPPDALAHLCTDDVTERLSHARGKAFRDIARNLEGRVEHVPDLVARPRTEADVVDLLDWCTTESTAVVPYGGGSSVVGGIEPRFDSPCLTIDLTALDRVLELDATSRAARIQAGALGPRLEAQLRPHDLTLRHFPQSFAFSTLGGWLATRAGGHFATLYTHIDDLTESMRVVTSRGISESRRLPGSGAGPSPDRLFLGSEGALGIITEAWMRLQERPRWQETASITFDRFDDAVAATRAIAQSGLYPTNCRLLDPAEAFINAATQTPGGLLILAFESADHPVTYRLDRATQIARDHGGTVRNTDRKDAVGPWRSAFLRMPYWRDVLVRHSVVVETFETACTWDRFADLHDAVSTAATEAVRNACGTGILTSRFTHVYPDGPAPYYGVYAGGRWGSLVAQWDEIKAAVSAAIVDAGGTITHHHAVGRDHRPWYDEQRSNLHAAALAAAKRAIDPTAILNPGVLV